MTIIRWHRARTAHPPAPRGLRDPALPAPCLQINNPWAFHTPSPDTSTPPPRPGVPTPSASRFLPGSSVFLARSSATQPVGQKPSSDAAATGAADAFNERKTNRRG